MTGWWQANLAALARREDGRPARSWTQQLEALGPAEDWGLRDRGGRIVPGILYRGQPRALVSVFDPTRESDRWSQDVNGGTVAVLGGAPRAAAQALDSRGTALAFWIEPRIEVWQNLLTWEDWTPWIARDTWIPVTESAPEWEGLLKNRYHPLWDGAFRMLEWRGATSGFEDLWPPYRDGTLKALDNLTSDTSTQARFGERWYRNTLLNLRALEAGEVEARPGARVVIAGAGPGLDDALDDPRELDWLAARVRNGGRVFSTDTALPALAARGVGADVVFCLDGQLATYHHFVPAVLPGAKLVADLASLPLLSRLGLPVVRYLSGHPFGLIIRRFFPEIPTLDGSLGNVSGLAWSTAMALGANPVECWGVDFSYRAGQTYARDAYVYPLAGRRAQRLEPIETILSRSCYGARHRERTWDDQGRPLDTTPLLRDYRRRWNAKSPRVARVSLAHGAAGSRWDRFREHWESRLRVLPIPPARTTMTAFVRTLPPAVREDWWALWPLALALHHQGAAGADLPETVVQRALSFLQD